MKLKIDDYGENVWILLVNLICSKAYLFENPEVSGPYPSRVGEIQIKSVKGGQTFEDVIDDELTTVVEGCALVALNKLEQFRLILSSDGIALLLHYNAIPPMLGRDSREVVLHKALL